MADQSVFRITKVSPADAWCLSILVPILIPELTPLSMVGLQG